MGGLLGDRLDLRMVSTWRHSVKGDSGGGRWIEVSPVRFPGWIDAFGIRHGATHEAPLALAGSRAGGASAEESVIFVAPPGALARSHPPLPGASQQVRL